MKKRLILSALMISALLLAACGSGKEEPAEEPYETESLVEAGDAAVEDESEDEEEAEDIKRSTTAFAEAAIEETELYNAGGVTVTATGFDADAAFGPEIAVQVVNESDTTVDVTVRDVAVNGFMLDPGLLYVVASPGTTIEDAITLYSFTLDACGIDTVTDVALNIVVMDDAAYEEIGVGDRITLTTSAAEGYDQAVDDSGDVIYDRDGIRVISQGLKQDEVWDGDLVLYMENDTDRYVGVACINISVNGQAEEYATLQGDLKAGTKTVTGMYLMDLNGGDLSSIDEVNEISFCLQIFDQDAWEEMDVTDEITLYFD